MSFTVWSELLTHETYKAIVFFSLDRGKEEETIAVTKLPKAGGGTGAVHSPLFPTVGMSRKVELRKDKGGKTGVNGQASTMVSGSVFRVFKAQGS